MMMLSGCVKDRVSETVVLDALCQPMSRLAGAVYEDGGVKSRRAARDVIAIYDAGRVDKPANHC